MSDREVEVALKLTSSGTNAASKVDALTKSLKDAETNANRLREKMEKVAQIGNKMAIVGGAMVAPFALALKKYVDTAKETEPVSARIVALSKQWEDSQVRLGRVTATVVLPALEAGATILDKVISFAEAHPGIVQAALTIGTTLVVLGGIISTTAQLVSTVATLQGLIASATLAASSGIVAGTGGGAAGAAVMTAATVQAGVAAAVPVLVAAIAVWAGGNLGLIIGNSIAGTNQSWDDIALTAKQILVLNGEALDIVSNWFGGTTNFSGAIAQALGISDVRQIGANVAIAKSTNATTASGFQALINSLGSWFRGGKAGGGYMDSPGFYAGAEKQREFVMSGSTTRTAESLLGGRLTQQSALSAITNNLQIGHGMTIRQTKRIARAESRAAFDALLG